MMFVDLVESTVLATQLDAEDLRGLNRPGLIGGSNS
jgi:hypothetical protein